MVIIVLVWFFLGLFLAIKQIESMSDAVLDVMAPWQMLLMVVAIVISAPAWLLGAIGRQVFIQKWK